MKRDFEVSVDIAAPVEAVWQVLVDLDAYGEWNPFVPVMESTLEVGTAAILHVDLWPGRRIRQRVEIFEVRRPELLCWGFVLGARALYESTRRQTLEPLAGGCRYRSIETLSGLIGPPMARIFGSAIRRGFEETAAALKARVESLVGARSNAHRQ